MFAKVDDSGKVVAGPDGRVDVIYKHAPGAKVYRAAAANLTALGDATLLPDIDLGAPPQAAGRASLPGAAPTAAPTDVVVVYTDGACTGNPGPMGIGVVVIVDGKRTEVSEYLGVGTNNIAELVAIERGLEVVRDLAAAVRPVWVHSDSSYALGLLGKGWKAKANVELVARLRTLARGFPRVEWVKVAGHAGVPENERCDELARAGVTKGGR